MGATRGTGTVYAAVSKDPFKFDQFANSGSEWRRSALPDSARGQNAEGVMTDVVQAMSSSGGRFDYDLVNFTVTSPRDRTRGAYAYSEGPPADGYDGGYGSPYYGNGYGYGYGPYCDPWSCGPGYAFAYDPWFYNPWFYSPFGFGFGFGPRIGFGFGFGFGGGFFPGRFAFGGRPFFPGHAFVGGAPIGFRGRGQVLASRGNAVFANARLTASRGGIGGGGFRGGFASNGGATVFRHVQAAGPSARPGSGRLVVRGDAAAGGAMAGRGPAMAERVSRGGAMGDGAFNGSRNGAPSGERAARSAGSMGHRVEAAPQNMGPREGGGGREGGVREGGAREGGAREGGAREGGGHEGGGVRASGGGGHSSGGHSGGGGGHSGGGGGGGGHGGGHH